jgi:hypothetical protein
VPDDREDQTENRTTAYLAFQLNSSAMGKHDLFCQVQTHAEALA